MIIGRTKQNTGDLWCMAANPAGLQFRWDDDGRIKEIWLTVHDGDRYEYKVNINVPYEIDLMRRSFAKEARRGKTDLPEPAF